MDIGVRAMLPLLVLGLLAAPALLGQGSGTSGGGSVSPYYGSFATEVPIAIPGFRGLEPAVKLTYNSSGGNSLAGLGWSLSAGSSVIERGRPGGGTPAYDSTDAFFMDGMELLPSDIQGGTHCTKVQNYARIERDAANDRWVVTGTNGNRATYEPKLTRPEGTFRWLLTSIVDPHDNTVTFTYFQDGTDDCYPRTVEYNGAAVTMNWDIRPDTMLFADGKGFRTTRYRLKSIDVTVGGQRARAYGLAYGTSPDSFRSILTGVTQYGRDASLAPNGTITGGSSLPPMQFGWSSGSNATYAARVNDLTDGANHTGTARLLDDVNGDGKADIIYLSASSAHCYLSEGFGNFGARVSDDIGQNLPSHTRATGDFNNDGKADLIFIGDSDIQVFLGVGNGTFSDRVLTQAPGGHSGETRSMADVNGDQRTDILYISATRITVLPGQGNGGFGTEIVTTASGLGAAEDNRLLADVDGDGRSDLMIVEDAAFKVLRSKGDGTFAAAIVGSTGGASFTGRARRNADLNGDNKTDLLYIGDSAVSTFLSKGDGSFGPEIVHALGATLAGYDRYLDDANGDGKPDLLFLKDDAITVFPGVGDGTFRARIDSSPGTAIASGHTRTLADVDGDGKGDIVWLDDDDTAVCLANGPHPDLIVSMANGIGGATQIDYQPSSRWENTYLPRGMILQTVETLTTADGRGTSASTNYIYAGGLWSIDDRRFLGFRRVSAVIDPEGNYTETYYFQRVGSISKPEYTYFKNPDGKIYNYSAYRYTENLAPPYTSLLTERWDYEMYLTDRGRRTLVQFAYDRYANVVASYEHGDYDRPGDEKTTLRGYFPNHTKYIVGLPAYENVYEGIGDRRRLLQRALSLYDGNTDHRAMPLRGDLTEKREWDDYKGRYIVGKAEYDRFGNVVRRIDPRGQEWRTVFDPAYHIFVVENRNPLNQVARTTWDPVSELRTSELDPNGAANDYYHDMFGRVTSIRMPDGSISRSEYLDWGNPISQRVRTIVPDGTPDGLWAESYQDGLGRVYKTVIEGGVTTEKQYRSTSENISAESLPYGPGDPVKWITHDFDGAGRLRLTRLSDGTTAEVVYGIDSEGRPYIANYDELGREKVTWNDAYGRLSQVRETVSGRHAFTTYAHDAVGRLAAVIDAAGNVSRFHFDSLGRKISVATPGMGEWLYAYDDGGLAVSQTDARGMTTRFTHDPVGRQVTKMDADGKETRWLYDAPGYGASIGRLCRVDYPSGSETAFHDLRGRVTSVSRTVAGVTEAVRSELDAIGRLTRMIYPDGEVVTYSYDSQSRMRSVSGYVTDMQWTSGGQLQSMTYANGTVSTFDYDPDRQWLDRSRVTGPHGLIHDAAYTYNAAGAVFSAASASDPSLNYTTTYDDLNRLLSVEGGQTQSFGYDTLGNLIFNSELGTYSYPDRSRPHSVVQAGRDSLSYDANGNRLNDGSRSYTWNAENQLAAASRDGQTTSFAYDHTGSRVRRSGASGETLSFGPLVERVDGKRVKYVYVGSMLITRRDENGPVWYHADRLGSVRAMTDASGSVVRNYGYSPFGQTRGASDIAANDRGFTGHRRDADTGLLFMGARYYDPSTCQFVSPDSIVPDPENPQALNRYSYVYNDPLNNTDPTGHAPVVVAVISAAMVSSTPAIATWVAVTAWVGAGLSVAGYFAKDPILSSVGAVMLGFAGGWATAPAGATSGALFGGGILGGSVAASTSPLSPLDPGTKQAIGWAYSGFGKINSMEAAVEHSLYIATTEAARAGVSAIERKAGIKSGMLNDVLTVASVAGTIIPGWSRYSREGKDGVNIVGVGHRDAIGGVFDVVDIALAYQGMLTGSAAAYAMDSGRPLHVTGHSLGAADANNLVALGYASSATVFSLPFGRAQAPGVQANLGSRDLVNGGSFGMIFSPFANRVDQSRSAAASMSGGLLKYHGLKYGYGVE
ncbi:MAG: FG-GAP-like repeat-containing protein [Verrucomicrobia bacterium]|nr:FG-GAP-like repeat-containing protein [Verrucomicrobiota bacterium]